MFDVTSLINNLIPAAELTAQQQTIIDYKSEVDQLQSIVNSKEALLSYNVEHNNDELIEIYGQKFLAATIRLHRAQNKLHDAMSEYCIG